MPDPHGVLATSLYPVRIDSDPHAVPSELRNGFWLCGLSNKKPAMIILHAVSGHCGDAMAVILQMGAIASCKGRESASPRGSATLFRVHFRLANRHDSHATPSNAVLRAYLFSLLDQNWHSAGRPAVIRLSRGVTPLDRPRNNAGLAKRWQQLVQTAKTTRITPRNVAPSNIVEMAGIHKPTVNPANSGVVYSLVTPTERRLFPSATPGAPQCPEPSPCPVTSNCLSCPTHDSRACLSAAD